MNELRDRVVQEVRKVVIGQDGVVEVLLAAVTVGGHQVYGLEISAGMGYRDNSTSGVATNGAAEGTAARPAPPAR